VVPAWPSGAQTYLSARRRGSGHMMMGGVTPKRGVAAAPSVRVARDFSPGGSSTSGAGSNIEDRRGGLKGPYISTCRYIESLHTGCRTKRRLPGQGLVVDW